MSQPYTRISKFLSLVLRHAPERVGLTLEEGGWVQVHALLEAAQGAGVPLDEPLLRRVLMENDKQRFAFNEDGTKIRASQGHSVPIDLGLEPQTPPDLLHHGTATRFLDSIRASGLRRGSRTHVHLSPDHETALKVGARHGKPVVLKVKSGEMARGGFIFTRAPNGVWLTGHVPVRCLVFPEDPGE